MSTKKESSLTGTITRTFEVDSTVARAFEAFTNKKDLEMWKADDYEIDPKKGGKFKMGLESDGYAVTGEFLEIVPNSKLVYTWKMNEYDPKTKRLIPHWSQDTPTIVTVKFEKKARGKNAGTKITLIHEGFPGRDEQFYMHEVGWDLLIGEILKAYLEKSPSQFAKWWQAKESKWQENWQKLAKQRMRF